MDELRLGWEPDNLTPLADIEGRMRSYGAQGVTLLGNGTLLFITGGDDPENDAKRGLNEARFLTDFQPVELKEGGYLVKFHRAVAVFVGAEEFNAMRSDIDRRLSELCFPGEHFIVPDGSTQLLQLVGLYARGKLQKDCYSFNFYKRL
ncbi:MAG: hypothetical protein R3E99_17845 [Burkholderiaceae bacterium]